MQKRETIHTSLPSLSDQAAIALGISRDDDVPMANSPATSIVRWEVSRLIAEVIGVAVGLWLMLGTPASEFGGMVLLFICAISFVARWRRYAGQPQQR